MANKTEQEKGNLKLVKMNLSASWQYSFNGQSMVKESKRERGREWERERWTF